MLEKQEQRAGSAVESSKWKGLSAVESSKWKVGRKRLKAKAKD